MNKISAVAAHKPKSREVIYPNFVYQLILLGISAVFVFGLFVTDIIYENPFLAYTGGVFFGGGALVLLYSLITRRPQIILDEQSLIYKNIFKTKSWRWIELGPFELDKQVTRKGFVKITVYYLCALRREEAELLVANNDPAKPAYATSEAVIDLNSHFLNGQKRRDLRDKVNHYREKVIQSAPFDQSLLTDDGYSNLKEKFKKKQSRMAIGILCALFFLILIFSAELIFNILN